MAISQVTKEIYNRETPEYSQLNPQDYGKFLVISLGTGTPKLERKFDAKDAAKWGIFGWLLNDGQTPLIDAFSHGNTDVVDIHISVIFQTFQSQENYHRIQVNCLSTSYSNYNCHDPSLRPT